MRIIIIIIVVVLVVVLTLVLRSAAVRGGWRPCNGLRSTAIRIEVIVRQSFVCLGRINKAQTQRVGEREREREVLLTHCKQLTL